MFIGTFKGCDASMATVWNSHQEKWVAACLYSNLWDNGKRTYPCYDDLRFKNEEFYEEELLSWMPWQDLLEYPRNAPSD